MNQKYFISGHVDLTQEEFNQHYLPRITEVAENGAHFVVGDAYGADYLAQKYLNDLGIDKNRVTVYHRFENPQYDFGFNRVPNFKSHPQKDEHMTENSTDDIAWIRPQTPEYVEKIKAELEAQGKKYDPGRISGTEKNLLRRNKI